VAWQIEEVRRGVLALVSHDKTLIVTVRDFAKRLDV
jgi:hypothetical protein